MNLLKTDTLELVHVARNKPAPPYAILSHRWEKHEITLSELATLRAALVKSSSNEIPARLSASATKIRGACALARRQGLQYVWIDTCCIDKPNSVELDYALNMMYQWYRSAAVCYTYLNDVVFERRSGKMFLSDQPARRGRPSEWFERGWTLQELLAPQRMEFYDKRWKYMGTRKELAGEVGKNAGINPEYLSGKRAIEEASCATKMSWMAGRITHEVEDIAYSLIGLFGVYLRPIYGEGVRAFVRLQEALLTEYGRFDESLFAWKRPSDSMLCCYRNAPRFHRFEHSKWGLLAPSPDCFKTTGDIMIRKEFVEKRPGYGFKMSDQGLFFSLPANDVNQRLGGARPEISMPLSCWRVGPSGAHERVVLKLVRMPNGEIFRAQCDQLGSQKDAGTSSGKSVIIAVGQPLLGTVRA